VPPGARLVEQRVHRGGIGVRRGRGGADRVKRDRVDHVVVHPGAAQQAIALRRHAGRVADQIEARAVGQLAGRPHRAVSQF